MKKIKRWIGMTAIAAAVFPTVAYATHPCTSPLVLDLDGDGRILTSGIERAIEFDMNADGIPDEIGWTAVDPEEGFLALDLNENGIIDDGGELFGSSTMMPSGVFASNGFEALSAYDLPELGGNGDGVISPQDLIWNHLRIWVDTNHDGHSQRSEIRPLDGLGLISINLEFQEVNQVDGNLNAHWLRGSYLQRAWAFGRVQVRKQIVEDIFFISTEAIENR